MINMTECLLSRHVPSCVATAIVTDYRFLEEVGCYVDSIDRDSLVRSHQKKNYALNVILIISCTAIS